MNPNNGIDVNVKYGAFANIRIADSVFSGATDAGLLIHGRNDGAAVQPGPGIARQRRPRGPHRHRQQRRSRQRAGGINVSTATTNVSVTRSRIVGNGVGGG